MFQETLQMLEDHPIWGGGLANYQNAIQPYHHPSHVYEIYLYPHHFVLNFWTELGLLGMLSVFLLIVKYFANYLKAKKVNSKNRP